MVGIVFHRKFLFENAESFATAEALVTASSEGIINMHNSEQIITVETSHLIAQVNALGYVCNSTDNRVRLDDLHSRATE